MAAKKASLASSGRFRAHSTQPAYTNTVSCRRSGIKSVNGVLSVHYVTWHSMAIWCQLQQVIPIYISCG